MLLGRLRIRGKLALLVLIPLLATIALTISNAVELVGKASRAQQTASAVRVARLTGELIRDLQQERLLSVGLLRRNADRAQLSLVNASVTEKASNLRRLGSDLPPAVAAAVDKVNGLDALRTAALTGSASVANIFAGYGATITGLIDSTRLLDAVDGDTAQGRQVIALDAIMRANEGFATLLAAMAIVSTPVELIPFAPSVAVILPAAVRFTTYATPDQLALYQTSIGAVDARLGPDFATGLLTNFGDLVQLKALPTFAAIDSLTGVGRFVETKIINDVLGAATSSANQESTQAVGFGVLSLVTILLVVLLGVAVAQSVAGPLRRLTQSADRVARLAESELVRVADDDSPATEPARLRPIDVAGRDELCDLARAFGRVQDTAAQLVQRQVASRRNVAQMFGHVGRRTQNLVGRQVALIDKLENDETEPSRLRDLYRLDHVSSRLRRSASSLVVLSGATGADEHITPVALGDVVRLALAEIEDYSRVDVEVSTSVRVVPSLISDLVLLLAELMENATTFSPPGTQVSVSAVTVGDQARLSIVDHGLGMSAVRMAEENARLTRRERLDLAPTEVLGLFVVGRLARRHGLVVTLQPTGGSGVTVVVDVPSHLLTDPIATPAPVTAMRARTAIGSAGPAERARTMLLLANADPQIFNVGALNRATRTLHSVQPWNAFEPPPAVRAESESTAASATGRSVDQLVPRQRDAEQVPAPRRLPQVPQPAVAAGSDLRKRVPGAQLPSAGTGRRFGQAPVEPDTLPDPSQARDLVEAFESGVQRAQNEQAGAEQNGPGLANLNRRVPGATLSSLRAQTRSRPAVSQLPQPADADQARDSLADFESGVARAMREVDESRKRRPWEVPSFAPPVANGHEELFPGGRGYHDPEADQPGNDDRRTNEEGSDE